MKRQPIIGLGLSVTMLVGCASPLAPDAKLIQHLPVLEIGQPTPKGHEYVLHVAKGKSIPVKLTVGGSFLLKDKRTETTIQVHRDVYLYKQWASFDGKTWRRSHDVFSTTLSAGLSPEGALVQIKIDGKKQK